MAQSYRLICGVLLALLVTAASVIGPEARAAEDNLVAHSRNAKGIEARIVWIELSANLKALSTREGVAAMMDKLAAAHINTIVIEAKNAWAFTNYPSAIAPDISQSPLNRENAPYEYARYPAPNTGWYDPNFDQLQVVIEEAHRRGLQVHAATNMFSEGLNWMRNDPVMRSLAPAFVHPEWQSIYYVGVRQVSAENGAGYDLSGSDTVRGADQLIRYTPEYYRSSPPNRWGADVYVVDGLVQEIRDRSSTGEGPIPVSDAGYVLSGHGAARSWILNNLQVGDRVDIGAARGKFVSSSEAGTFTFVNPHLPEVQEYELSILREIAANYDVDGIVLDRTRFNNITADFSPQARARFEDYIGRALSADEWPSAIFSYRYSDEEGFQRVEGPLYRQWLEFRAATIGDFIARAKAAVHEIDPNLVFSNYVGSWYPVYWNEGVAWGASSTQLSYDWMTPTFHQRAGTAQLYDYLMTGLYYETVTKQEALEQGREAWWSVEGSAEVANQAVDDKTFHVGSLFLLQYANDPERFRHALRTSVEKTHGIMLFDLVYIEVFDWWSILEEEFREPARAPYTIPGLLQYVRADD